MRENNSSIASSNDFYLASHLQLIVHTRTAAELLEDRWYPGHIGLRQFGQLAWQIWKASKLDDPYADWHLMRIYEALQEKKAWFQQLEQQAASLLSAVRGMEIVLFANPQPYKYPLKFNTPFGFMGALLLENVDYVSRQLFTLRQLGLSLPDISFKRLRREIQLVFSMACDWRHTGVTRQDLVHRNPKAQLAMEKMGQVPKEIVQREISLNFLPKGSTDKSEKLATTATAA